MHGILSNDHVMRDKKKLQINLQMLFLFEKPRMEARKM
jgi:hypothetical protein